MTLGVGMVGHAFMGAAHSQAWRTAGRFFDLPLTPDMAVLCGRDVTTARAAADRLGWRDVETDWKQLLTREDVQLVDVCAPGDVHAEIAVAALEAGKHVLCEKPLANTVEEARAMVAAAERAQAAGVRSMVGFNYRRVPAVTLARRLVEQGRIGEVRHVRATYLQDWIVDPDAPLVWRLQVERAGSGALGDIGAHVVDLAQFVTGDRLTGVCGLTETFVRERPLPSGEGRGPVTVDDAALFLGRFSGGALASFEATRFATGRKNQIRLEVNGSAGSLAFDFEQMNELQYFDGGDDAEVAGFRRIIVTEPAHPYAGAWWPPGHGLGYEHTFTHEIVDLVRDVAAGADPVPSFADGLQVQLVLDAVTRSAAAGSQWKEIDA
ncbi:Gfo/Idh/MocA family protein [Pseudonocardia abyssalis]|uniref:Gfo/Idh/MocA family oxidoreductase n=1 Tax=Pseudonocardia abyssalis TaxID=2792008 RepID=A0ABS6URL3_9PSEU|nr:Gfo/Idh/MocA family oxidoreductase [Pseudonocardia abyssalis]MBW0117535.1 Gfo/Idh/MocA family oxidoreductase [Pseudonocardia abyssalis]MBW0134576.1 Gfo/Idh/MocA family oxidoreductase [Pseudonocardia abyssalis]